MCAITEEILAKLVDVEDALDALANGYYDTHDLKYIESKQEDYQDLLDAYKNLLPTGINYFCDCKIENNKLIEKYENIKIQTFVYGPNGRIIDTLAE